jgi:hypothetical protein
MQPRSESRWEVDGSSCTGQTAAAFSLGRTKQTIALLPLRLSSVARWLRTTMKVCFLFAWLVRADPCALRLNPIQGGSRCVCSPLLAWLGCGFASAPPEKKPAPCSVVFGDDSTAYVSVAMEQGFAAAGAAGARGMLLSVADVSRHSSGLKPLVCPFFDQGVSPRQFLSPETI